MISLRSALKRLYTDGRFTVVSVVTLAIGIGLTVAIFSLVYGVLLAPLPYPRPDRLVVVTHEAPGLELDDMDVSVPPTSVTGSASTHSRRSRSSATGG